jgi:hypothetical protein
LKQQPNYQTLLVLLSIALPIKHDEESSTSYQTELQNSTNNKRRTTRDVLDFNQPYQLQVGLQGSHTDIRIYHRFAKSLFTTR